MRGWMPERVEHGIFVPAGEPTYVHMLRRAARLFAMTKRRDPFCADILALDDDPGMRAIQATSASNVGARVRKACADERVARLLERGNRFEVWGWKQKKKGARWTRVVRVLGLDEDGSVSATPGEP